jgi:hypothetical protein
MVQVKTLVSAAIVALLSLAAARTRRNKTAGCASRHCSHLRSIAMSSPSSSSTARDCHRSGEIGPMPLVTYENARSHSLEIADVVAKKKMPPWFADPRYGHFSNDPSLTADGNSKARVPGRTRMHRQAIRKTRRLRVKWTRGMEYSPAGRNCENADGRRAAGSWRRGVHIRNRAHRIHGR